MKDRTKQTIADGFGGLVKNATALRGAKNGPLWLTIVMFFASILLPILPLFVSANSMSGSSFIKNNTYSLERYVTRAALDLKKSPNKYEISISEDHFLSVNKEGTEINYGSYDDHGKDADRTIAPFYTYTNKATGEYSFLLYVSDIDNTAEKVETTNAKGKTKLINAKTAYLTRIAQFTYETGTTTSYDLGKEDQKKAVEDAKKKDSTDPKTFYFPSYIVLFKDSFNVVCCYGEKAVAGSTNGAADYKKVSANANCLETLLTVKDKKGNDVIGTDPKIIDGTATEEEIEADIGHKMACEDYYNGVLANFKKFLNKSYLASKAKTTAVTCLFSLAVFAGLSLIMGFLMWVMTRGKNNPNNYFSLWLCLKLEARLALAPALITLLLGFLLVSYAQMIFILTLGMRVMWISMKELRPVQQ
ncbi:MAG: hypothetical protein J6T25_02635 [Bacilli bacterium]|nr:hypothetical protein [Bacilli bacterium]